MDRRRFLAAVSAGVAAGAAGCASVPGLGGNDDEAVAAASDRLAEIDAALRAFADPSVEAPLEPEALDRTLAAAEGDIDRASGDRGEYLRALGRLYAALVPYNASLASFFETLTGSVPGGGPGGSVGSYYRSEAEQAGDPNDWLARALDSLATADDRYEGVQRAAAAVSSSSFEPSALPDAPTVDRLDPRVYLTGAELAAGTDLFDRVREHHDIRGEAAAVFAGPYSDERWPEAIERFAAVEDRYESLVAAFDRFPTRETFPDRFDPDLEYHREMSVVGRRVAGIRRRAAAALAEDNAPRARELRREILDVETPEVPRI